MRYSLTSAAMVAAALLALLPGGIASAAVRDFQCDFASCDVDGSICRGDDCRNEDRNELRVNCRNGEEEFELEDENARVRPHQADLVIAGQEDTRRAAVIVRNFNEQDEDFTSRLLMRRAGDEGHQTLDGTCHFN